MSSDTPTLLANFNRSLKSLPDRGSSYTLSKYVERNGIESSELKKLTDAVSAKVYSRYSKIIQNGSTISFARFLLERCNDMDDALKTPEYKKARDASERRQAVLSWFNRISANSDLGKKKTAGLVSPTVGQGTLEETPADVDTAIVNFYAKYAGAAVPRAPQKKNVVHTTLFEAPTTQNIVVQPPAKGKKNKKKGMEENINHISSGNYAAVPRKDLEALATHLEDSIKKGDSKSSVVYTKVVDLIHNNFDCCDVGQIKEALKIAKDNKLESLPKRERRALVDLFSRGSPETLQDLAKQESECCDFITKNKKNLHAMADQDLLRFAPRLADIIAKNFPENEKQAYVLGHNETPILRVLLNNGEDEKMARYMQFRKLASAEVSKSKQNAFANGGLSNTWDSTLSEAEPFVSKDEKIFIYASAPYRDDISYFRKWAKDACCSDEKDNIWLAPTDEVIVAKGINDQASSWTPEQLKKFVLAHQVKKNSKFFAKVKKMSQGQQAWITKYKMTSGKEGKAIVKTKVFVDQASENVFIPVNYVLC